MFAIPVLSVPGLGALGHRAASGDPLATRRVGKEVACPQPQLSMEAGRASAWGPLRPRRAGGPQTQSYHPDTSRLLPSSLVPSRAPPTP